MKKLLLVLLIALIGVLPAMVPMSAHAQPKPPESSQLITPQDRNILLVLTGALVSVAATSAIFNTSSAPWAIVNAAGIGSLGFLASVIAGGYIGNWVNSKL